MHYEINYSEIENPELKKEKAIQDCKNWFGDDGFTTVVEALSKMEHRTSAIFGLSFAGVQGYPAEVLVDEYCKKLKDDCKSEI